MIDDKGRLFGKLSIIDIFVVVLILGVIAGTAYKLKGPVATVNRGDKTIYYTVKISDVRSFTTDYYEEGMRVCDSKSGAYIGKIDAIRVEPYMDTVIMNDGTLKLAEKPGKVEIYLDLSAEGVETDQSFLVGGTYEVKAGTGAYLSTKKVEVQGSVEKVWAE